MYLHKDKNAFKKIVSAVANTMEIDDYFVEKDYYVTLFLKELQKREPSMVFKGGTSLSKCYGVINRFSEDIDLNLDQSCRLSQGRRKHFKEHIVETAAVLDLFISNLESTRSRRNYNKYEIDYLSLFTMSTIKPRLLVETVYTISAFPVEQREVKSFIYDYLNEQNEIRLIEKYNLAPFKVMVQSLERTFIDKIFALCDYVLDGRIREHSRHIYDLHMLMPHIKMNEELQMLYKEVKAIRSVCEHCLSARYEEGMAVLLRKIINDDLYERDYNDITSPLLLKKVSYKDAMESIDTIYNFIANIELQSGSCSGDDSNFHM